MEAGLQAEQYQGPGFHQPSVQQGFLVRASFLSEGHEALHREGDEAVVMGEEASEQSVWDCVGLPGSQIA